MCMRARSVSEGSCRDPSHASGSDKRGLPPGARPRGYARSTFIAVLIAVAAASRTAAAAAAAAVATAGPGTVLTRLGFVHRQGAALQLGAVELLDGLVATLAHFDEAEPA